MKLAAIGLYVLTYLYLLYLGRIRGYDSMMIGETLFISGLCMFLTAPLAGFLSGKMDLRVMMMIGFLGFAAGARSMLMKKPARAAAGGGH